MNWIKRLFCKHDLRFVRNVYGDEINALDCRSLWVCAKCKKVVRKDFLAGLRDQTP